CTGYRPIIEAFSTFGSGCGGCSGSKDGKCCRENSESGSLFEERLVKWKDFPKYDPTQEIIFPPELIKIISGSSSTDLPIFRGPNLEIFAPNSLSHLENKNVPSDAKVVSSGLLTVSLRNKIPISKKETWISLQNCNTTKSADYNEGKLFIGSSLSLTDVREAFDSLKNPKFDEVLWYLDQFSSTHVRNNATWTGSLLSASGDFPTLALAFGMRLQIFDFVSKQTETTLVNEPFFEKITGKFKSKEILTSGVFDVDTVENIKTAKFDVSGSSVSLVQVQRKDGSSKIAVGGISDFPVLVENSDFENLMKEKKLLGKKNSEYLELLVGKATTEKTLEDPEFETLQLYMPTPNNNNQEHWPVGRPLAHQYADRHTTGEAVYAGDVQPPGLLHIAPVMSTMSHAEILSIDPSEALKLPGVVDFISVKDIPGTNIPGEHPGNDGPDDAEVFAEKKVLYVGHIVGGVVAETPLIARKAAKLVKIEYKKLDPILSIKDAIKADSFFTPEPITVVTGQDPDEAFLSCAHVVEGNIRLEGQQHVYLEPQSAVCIPQEDQEWTIYSATQSPTIAQLQSALILGIQKHQITVKCKRVGGAFGGKVNAQSGYALYPALVAANKIKKPVSCVFTREEDFVITGGRHPADCYYKLGCDSEGNLVAGKFIIHALGGYSQDVTTWVSTAICHNIDNCYKIPNLKVQVFSCKTNTPSNTAMRGFGQPQACFFIENAIDQLSRKANINPEKFREMNFFEEGDLKADGTEIIFDNLRLCWNECKKFSDFENLKNEVKEFNKSSKFLKRGICLVPTRFGVVHGLLFEQTFVLINIYLDGSVSISIGGIEMGQGLNTKILQVAATELNLPMERITIIENSTEKTANSPVTGGSQGADLHGHAVRKACQKLMEGIRPLMKENPKRSWEEIVILAHSERLPLSVGEHCTYPRNRPGEGPCYHTSGAACIVTEVDIRTGEHVVKKVQIILDTGYSLNPAIDVGQIEGAFIQMYGLMTMESTAVDETTGRVINDTFLKYKVPRARDVPEKFQVKLLGRPNDSFGAIYSSKATGEPPYMLGSGTYFAIKDAILSLNESTENPQLNSLRPPLTPTTVMEAIKELKAQGQS
ncbi:hypothetical protein FO519_004291, partial [Halicephalobus sp. NKZ332]